MFTKNQVISHLDNFIAYATKTAGKDSDYLQPLADTLLESIEDYYSIAIDLKVRRCIESVTHAMIRGAASDSFSDVRESFKAPALFMNLTAEALTDSLTESIDEVTGLVTGYDSELIRAVIDAIDAEADYLPSSLDAYAAIAEKSNQIDPVKILFDQNAKIEQPPNMAQIAEAVFVNLGFVEVIQTFALSIYVPDSVQRTGEV